MGMTNDVTQDRWTEIAVTVATADLELAGSIANMVVPYGIYIEDYSALEEETLAIAHIDLIEETLLQRDRTKGIIHIYVNPEENPLEATAFLTERLNSCGMRTTSLSLTAALRTGKTTGSNTLSQCRSASGC